MPDMNVLKNRVEDAKRRLQDMSSVRNREKDALLGVWNKVRDQYLQQEQEIANLNARSSDLEARNDELTRMIDALLATVEGNPLEPGEDTLPDIRNLAEELLASAPGPGTVVDRPATETHDETPNYFEGGDEPDEIIIVDDEERGVSESPGPAEFAAHEGDDDLVTLDDDTPPDDVFEIDPIARDSGDAMGATRETPFAAGGGAGAAGRRAGEQSASHGIRALMSRLQGKMEVRNSGPTIEVAPDGEDGDDGRMAQELREIEALRNELSGLRDKISSEDDDS